MRSAINLITSWEDDRPQFRQLESKTVDLHQYPDDSLTNKLLTEEIGACGNYNAGKGPMRVIVNGDEFLPEDEQGIFRITGVCFPFLGDRILVSAGHFMPVKSNPELVNSNSLKLLGNGLDMVKRLIESGRQADLLITINDVTVLGQNDFYETPTLKSDERKAYYEHFQLPALYRKKIIELKEELGDTFSVYVVGENKLAERLSKIAGKLTDLGALVHITNPSGYQLNFDAGKMVALAHNTYAARSIFISNENGVSGRPKCVRACTKLAALPHEMKYSGFIQYLPVCSRNALEGYMIGSKIFSLKYGKAIPYISIHNTRSCF